MTEQEERMALLFELRQTLSENFTTVLTEKPVKDLTRTPRNWRCDFFCSLFDSEHKGLIIEVNGGNFTNGRHTRGASYAKDLEKLNHLAANGYVVLQFTYNCLRKKLHHDLIRCYIKTHQTP